MLLHPSLLPEPAATAPAGPLNQCPAPSEADSTLSSPPRLPLEHFLLNDTLGAHDGHVICNEGSQLSSENLWEELAAKLNLPEDWETFSKIEFDFFGVMPLE